MKPRIALRTLPFALALGLATAQEPGKLPLDYPVVTTPAEVGQWILCPPREFVDALIKDGPTKTSVIHYAATMKAPGPAESAVVNLTRKEFSVPNSLIIPIPKGQTAKPGDVLLTWWQSGSGMKRAIVVEGGTETEPAVLYLDIAYDNPSGWGKKTDRCRPDTFYKLATPGEAGTSVAVRDPKFPANRLVYQVLATTPERCLLLGFAGRVSAVAKSDCVPLPIIPEALKEGDTVYAPISFCKIEQVKVARIDAKIGRVFVTAKVFGKEKELAIPFGEVAAQLP